MGLIERKGLFERVDRKKPALTQIYIRINIEHMKEDPSQGMTGATRLVISRKRLESVRLGWACG